jgi:hypothetical protein
VVRFDPVLSRALSVYRQHPVPFGWHVAAPLRQCPVPFCWHFAPSTTLRASGTFFCWHCPAPLPLLASWRCPVTSDWHVAVSFPIHASSTLDGVFTIISVKPHTSSFLGCPTLRPLTRPLPSTLSVHFPVCFRNLLYDLRCWHNMFFHWHPLMTTGFVKMEEGGEAAEAARAAAEPVESSSTAAFMPAAANFPGSQWIAGETFLSSTYFRRHFTSRTRTTHDTTLDIVSFSFGWINFTCMALRTDVSQRCRPK